MEKLPVYLAHVSGNGKSRCCNIGYPKFDTILSEILDIFMPGGISGANILIKPNLLKAGEPLCVTSPEMIVGVSRQVLDRGARVTVADSPAFGPAEKVLQFLGILDKLKRLGINVCSLKKPVRTRLPCGIKIGISKTALDADLIVNIPRLKTHCQLGITGAVKNTFGTVVGFRKALAHCLYGRDRRLFSSLILEISQLLPLTVSIVDAVTMMHVTGPSGGRPLFLGVVAAGRYPVAVDTCVYHILGVKPGNVPIWQRAREKGVAGSRVEEIRFLKRNPRDFSIRHGLIIPEALEPITFNPYRFLKGRTKSFLKRLF